MEEALKELINSIKETNEDTDGTIRAKKALKFRKEKKFDESVKNILDEKNCFSAIVVSNNGIVTMGRKSEVLSLLTMIMTSFLENGIDIEDIEKVKELAKNTHENKDYPEKAAKEMLKEILDKVL